MSEEKENRERRKRFKWNGQFKNQKQISAALLRVQGFY